MGNYEQLKQAVSDVIKTNGNQEITGAILQNALLTIISTVGDGATFAGIATPTTNPGTPDQNVFYLASQKGVYVNFGGVELLDQMVIFTNKNGDWVKYNTGIAILSELRRLDNNYGEIFLNSLGYENLLTELGKYKNGIQTDGGYNSGYIPIQDIGIGVLMTYMAVSGYDPITFFDSDKQYISSVSESGGIIKTNVFLKSSFPNNASFIIISSNNTTYKTIVSKNAFDEIEGIKGVFNIGEIKYIGDGKTYDYLVIKKIILQPGYYSLKIGNITQPNNGDAKVYIRAFKGGLDAGSIIGLQANETKNFIVSDDVEYVEVRFYAGVSVASQLNFVYIVSSIGISRDESQYNIWKGAKGAGYGDSITAQCNGDYIGVFNKTWLPNMAEKLEFSELYCRGVGGQTYKWNDVAYYSKVGGTGNYVNRYKAKNGQISSNNGTVTVDTTEAEKLEIETVLGYPIEIHRGCFCSWDRITSMFPEGIKDMIDVIYIMGGTNDFSGVEEIESGRTDGSLRPLWSVDNQTDTDWINAEGYYNGGDYDVTNTWGGMASCLMKMQIWMPQAKVIVLVPITRKGINYNNPTNDLGATYQDLSNSIKSVADWCNVEVVDMMCCGITQWNADDTIPDGVHPQQGMGWSRMTSYLKSKMNAIPRYE